MAGRNLKARLATEIGTRISLRIYWGDSCSGRSCHNAIKHLKDTPEKVNKQHYGGQPEDYPDALWPTECTDCGASVPPEGTVKQVFNSRLYDTDSGKPEPGCLYWANWYPDNFFWANHKGPVLMAVLPNGQHWNIDGRASNCGSPDDQQHRCWVRHGKPPVITVDKTGATCSAGAGSIIAGDWHGFLQNGFFIEC